MEKKMETTIMGSMGGCQMYGPFLDPYYNTAPTWAFLWHGKMCSRPFAILLGVWVDLLVSYERFFRNRALSMF